MKKTAASGKLLLYFLAMLILILDSRTAASGAAAGIEISLKTAIPSLLPAMILADILTQSINTYRIPLLASVGKLCGIPGGTEGIFIAGILSGYPIGAKLTGQAYKQGTMPKQAAEHMLSFCSNAGPAFIFGICGNLFTSYWTPLLLWVIHVISAIATAICLKNETPAQIKANPPKPRQLTEVVTNCVKTMSIICGWIVLFRVVIQFLQAWLLWLLPPAVSVVICGMLELTNGCCLLNQIPNEEIRFLLCSAMLSLGGLCILLQTAAVTEGLQLKPYLKGKLLQVVFSILISSFILTVINQSASFPQKTLTLLLIIPGTCAIFLFTKKYVAFRREMVYNTKKLSTR